ncbi:MAG: protein tyrosine phosphatase [Alphaproteobacteria bacterium]|nr:protein tyrosine phosphatase [Alphaproteobacteria bacterium]
MRFFPFLPDRRAERRMARTAYWDRPITTKTHRLMAWLNMIFVDHGIFRMIYLNFHKVTPDFWRSAQPGPADIHRLAHQGLKTIVNLRGGREYGSWPLEAEAASAQGIEIIDFILRSRDVPDRDTLLGAAQFFNNLQKPVLVHCKSGADRAGFMACLYLLVHEKRPLSEALLQLSARYGHFRWAKTGILDFFFETYGREGEARGLDFETWVRDHYDPDALRKAFHSGFWSTLIVDKILRRE